MLLWTASNFVLLIIWLLFLSFRLSSSSLSTPPVHQPIPVLSHTYTLAEIHLQGVCELWCSLPQRCYALTRMATSSHHALFCVEPVGRTSCLSMNGSNLSILTALVSLPFFVSLSFSVPLIDATIRANCLHTSYPTGLARSCVCASVRRAEGEKKREELCEGTASMTMQSGPRGREIDGRTDREREMIGNIHCILLNVLGIRGCRDPCQ